VTTDPLLPDFQRALAGRYVLERRLGRGGMGVVYLARELRLDRRVAIKLLPPERAVQPAARERFLREARTAAQLSHPGIVPIFAVHEVSDFVYFAMAYIDGDTLGRRVRHTGPVPYGAAARLLAEVARALAYAHDRGVVHRDVKPDNILLDQATGRPLVSDFGIARVGTATTTGPQRVVGTAEFMSPEQVLGERVDPRSDLYSLGVVGFFALSGELPFAGPDDMTVLARQVSDPAPPLASVAPHVPHRLAEAIDRCLAKDPAARFPNGEALAAELAAALDRRAAVAVRAFVTEARQLSTTALLYGAFAAVALPLLAVRLLEPQEPRTRVALLAVAVTLVAVPLVVMLSRVHRLRKAGYGQADLVDALRAELGHRREELAFLYGEGPSRLERALRRLCYVGIAVAGGIVAALERVPALAGVLGVPTLFGVVTTTALFAAVVARARTEHRTDPKAERRLRFWSGPLGGWLFTVVGLRVRRRATPAPGVLSPVATPVPDARDA
jgi:eukaryotic-like serine/threonine-protein kinase